MLNPRYVQVGSINSGATPINADVTVLGSAIAVQVTLTTAYAMLCPPGYPSRPSMTGAAAPDLSFPQTLPSGTTFSVLQCEANALIAASAATLG